MIPSTHPYDVIIAGGGAAGLEAALVLGRARRRVLLCDAGAPRNAPAAASHGVFTRDGTPPGELLRIGRAQLAPYESVQLATTIVAEAWPTDLGFRVRLGDGSEIDTRKLLLATGVRDVLPAVPGLQERWGRGVFHCPYCHGFEVRDRPLAVYGNDVDALHLAYLLTSWSEAIMICTDGPAGFSADDRRRLAASGIAIRESRLIGVEGAADGPMTLAFEHDDALVCGGLFLRPVLQQRSAIAEQLGCSLDERRLVQVDASQQTTVPGLYVAGDAASPVHSVLLAAASGQRAAFAVNAALTIEAIERRAASRQEAAPCATSW